MWNAWQNIEATSCYVQNYQPSARHCPEGKLGAATDVRELDRPSSRRPIPPPFDQVRDGMKAMTRWWDK